MDKIDLKEITPKRFVELGIQMRGLYEKHKVGDVVEDDKIMLILNESLAFCGNLHEVAFCWLVLGNKTGTASWRKETVNLRSIKQERQDELALECREIIKQYLSDEGNDRESKYSNMMMNLALNKSELALVSFAGSRFFTKK